MTIHDHPLHGSICVWKRRFNDYLVNNLARSQGDHNVAIGPKQPSCRPVPCMAWEPVHCGMGHCTVCIRSPYPCSRMLPLLMPGALDHRLVNGFKERHGATILSHCQPTSGAQSCDARAFHLRLKTSTIERSCRQIGGHSSTPQCLPSLHPLADLPSLTAAAWLAFADVRLHSR